MTPPAHTERGEETRRRIIEAATALFVEHGIAVTSINDVIQASGVTKGGFYFHFVSKMELAGEVIHQIGAEQHGRIVAMLDPQQRAVEQLAALARAAALDSHHPSAAAMCRLCFEVAGDAPASPPLPALDEWTALTTALLRRAQVEGDMDPLVDPEFAGRFVVTSFIGFEHVAELHRRRESLVDDVEPLLTTLFRACGITVPVPPALTPVGVGAGDPEDMT